MSKQIEIKNISANEIWVGENKSILIDGNIIHIKAVGDQTNEVAQAQLKVNHQLFNLIDGDAFFEARDIWNKQGDHEKVKKVGIYGIHPVARVIASFVMRTSSKKNRGFFKTKEEALTWLKK
jgi:hypothetical protein